jgi:hypothetical protein
VEGTALDLRQASLVTPGHNIKAPLSAIPPPKGPLQLGNGAPKASPAGKSKDGVGSSGKRKKASPNEDEAAAEQLAVPAPLPATQPPVGTLQLGDGAPKASPAGKLRGGVSSSGKRKKASQNGGDEAAAEQLAQPVPKKSKTAKGRSPHTREINPPPRF